MTGVKTSARLRDRQVLAAQIEALRAHAGRRGGPHEVTEEATADFQRGALDALSWVTRGGPAPLTGALAVLPMTLESIVGELAAAEDLLYGRPCRHRDYARGVEHALMWAQFATAAPPLTLSPRQRPRPSPTSPPPSPPGAARHVPTSSGAAGRRR